MPKLICLPRVVSVEVGAWVGDQRVQGAGGTRLGWSRPSLGSRAALDGQKERSWGSGGGPGRRGGEAETEGKRECVLLEKRMYLIYLFLFWTRLHGENQGRTPCPGPPFEALSRELREPADPGCSADRDVP